MSDRVIEILCRRDGIDEGEAQALIGEAIKQMEEVQYEPFACEDIMANVLGLEPDYIFDLLL